MYVGAPAWMGFTVLGLCRQAAFRLDLGLALFAVTLAMGLAPKLATLADVLLRAPLRRAYGGGLRVMASALLEIGFSMLIAPVSAVAVTIFIIGLFFRRRVGWTSQQRDAQALEPAIAVRALWPQTLVGIGLGVWLWRVAPGAVWYWTPLIAGLAGSIPIALVSAHPRLGRALARAGLCRIPEEALPAGGPPVPRALAPVPPYAAQESK